jgi:hypothetical protein
MTIHYYKKNVFGKDIMYFKDEGLARVWKTLTGRKTIDTADMELLESIGANFIQVLN